MIELRVQIGCRFAGQALSERYFARWTPGIQTRSPNRYAISQFLLGCGNVVQFPRDDLRIAARSRITRLSFLQRSGRWARVILRSENERSAC